MKFLGATIVQNAICYNGFVGWKFIATGCLTKWRMTMATKAKLRVNDLCRVIQAGGDLGPTLYMVEWTGERGRCVIREAGKPLAGGQEFDTSLLQKVERDSIAA
jgi:hypothetical protein